jgi:hypothetical protein
MGHVNAQYMYISRFQLGNYKSFLEMPAIQLGVGFNVICGQNNAGKTALLEGLSLNVAGNPHRSPRTVPTPLSQPDPNSVATVSFSLASEEFSQILRERGAQNYTIIAPAIGSEAARSVGYNAHNATDMQKFVRWFLKRDQYEFGLRKFFGADGGNLWDCAALPSCGCYQADGSVSKPQMQFRTKLDGSLDTVGPASTSVANHDIGTQLLSAFLGRIYRFNAERMNVGTTTFGSNPNLAPNAANLAQVLNILQGNISKFAEFNRLVREVMPQVKGVSVTPAGEKDVEIRVWMFDPDGQREDLTVSLSQCGTGIGQVLAILYVVLFSHSPRVLIIDEPQSFLHPGAIRKLFQVLQAYPQHQFIVATHSPTVVSAADPVSITMTKLEDGVTTLNRIDPADEKDMRSYLAEVGARLSDVFGADNILWVEGRTEEISFPKILARFEGPRLGGTSILGVLSIGELTKRDADRIFEMYNKLSGRSSLLPPAIGFIFDRECLTREEKDDLARRSRNLLSFLPRRMYENYLLNPNAIAAVASAVKGFRQTPVSTEEVSENLARLRSDPAFYKPLAVSEEHWYREINGALILKELFNRLSETRVSYDKVLHGVQLTEWLMRESPEELREVAALILSRLPPIEA